MNQNKIECGKIYNTLPINDISSNISREILTMLVFLKIAKEKILKKINTKSTKPKIPKIGSKERIKESSNTARSLNKSKFDLSTPNKYSFKERFLNRLQSSK
jgi:predicted amino acid-binding ACT domain protein